MFLSYLSKITLPPQKNKSLTSPIKKWFFFFEIFFCIAIIPIKLSISLMLMRVAGPKKNYTYALWGMASLFILANTISFLYILLRCTPISFAWNTTTPGGSCLPSRDLADVYYADTAVNILTDWFCALMYVLPFSLNPTKQTNLFLSFLFHFLVPSPSSTPSN